jgi:hypothetical protein
MDDGAERKMLLEALVDAKGRALKDVRRLPRQKHLIGRMSHETARHLDIRLTHARTATYRLGEWWEIDSPNLLRRGVRDIEELVKEVHDVAQTYQRFMRYQRLIEFDSWRNIYRRCANIAVVFIQFPTELVLLILEFVSPLHKDRWKSTLVTRRKRACERNKSNSCHSIQIDNNAISKH